LVSMSYRSDLPGRRGNLSGGIRRLLSLSVGTVYRKSLFRFLVCSDHLPAFIGAHTRDWTTVPSLVSDRGLNPGDDVVVNVMRPCWDYLEADA